MDKIEEPMKSILAALEKSIATGTTSANATATTIDAATSLIRTQKVIAQAALRETTQ